MTTRRTVQASLTQPQADFIQLAKKDKLFCGGYGSGKTHTMALNSVLSAQLSSKAVIGIYSATYGLLQSVNIPRVQEILDVYGFRYKYNKTDKEIHTSNSGVGDFVFRSMDRPERIIGYETLDSDIDELDTLPTDKAKIVWQKIQGRNRQKIEGVVRPKGLNNERRVYTTPEGYKFCYERFVLKADDKSGVVFAPSYSNPFLPDDYVEGMLREYPAPLVKAYIEGLFVNLTSGSVYNAYDRILHNSTEGIREKENLYIGQDFNVGNMASVIMVKRANGYHAVKAITGLLDTPELITLLSDRYGDHIIYIYPDASGDSRKTVGASETDITLLKSAGFKVKVRSKNPFVKDRVNSVNKAFTNGKIWVNSVTCQELAGSLEQQAYDKNGVPDKKSGHDHANDGLGYFVFHEMPIIKPVATMKIKFS